MSDYITQELLIEILKRLPAKSLVKFRCVCKSWYSLITSPNFISLQLTHSIKTNKTYSLVKLRSRTDHEGQLLLCNDKELNFPINGSKHPNPEIPSPVFIRSNLFEIVGSCNGLVCVSDQKDYCLYVWNPALRESVTIFSGKPIFLAGFGFDYKRNDYKVVRIDYDYELMGYDRKLIQPVVQICEVSSNAWRTISVKNLRYVVYGFGPRAYLNGVVHWFSHFRLGERNSEKLTIASFDFGDEEFGEVMVPDALANCTEMNLSLSVCGQLLTLIHYGSRVFDTRKIFCIWVMKEYGVSQSWSKQFTVNLQNHGGFLFVLSFWGDGEILLEKRKGELASYDPKTQRITSLGVYGATGHYKAYPYMESLLSPKGLSGMLGNTSSHPANYEEGASVLVEEDNEIERTQKVNASLEE